MRAGSSVARAHRGALALLVAPALLALPCAAGDFLALKDGRVYEADSMARLEKGIEITFKNGKVLVPYSMIEDAALAADAKVEPKTDEEREQLAKGFVRFEGRWLTVKQRDEVIAKRVAVHKEELRVMSERRHWRNRAKLDTRIFSYQYTIPDHVFEPYREAMDAYFAEFAKMWKIKTPRAEDKLPVCFHADEETFHQVSGAPAGVGGYFRFVRPYDLNIYYERLDPVESQYVMFHEANHYLQQLIDVRFSMPHFPGESLAEYYGASQWDPATKKFTTGLIQEGRLCEVEADVAAGEKVTLDRLITTEGMYEHYTWGWALVHFLMNDKRYQAKFQKFVFALPDGRGVPREPMGVDSLQTVKQANVLPVFMEQLGLKDAAALRKLESEWYDYIDKIKDMVTVSGKMRAAFKASETKRYIKARRLFKEAFDGGCKSLLAYDRYAELLAMDGKQADAVATWKQALEVDPLEGKLYWRLGAYMQRSKSLEAEGNRYVALAKELGYDPSYVDVTEEAKKAAEGGGDEPGDKPGDKPAGG